MPLVDEVVSSIDYVTLVVDNAGATQTLVKQTPAPVDAVTRVAADQTLVVGVQGPAGSGSGGSGTQNVFVQNGAPSSPPSTYAWFQTLLGNSGHDITLWIEDGT